ncbi:MAG: type II toxin-antitoxin system HipA family toxin [Gammaproteobacteria bacterium]|nr:type II toxin-antitoxin system HipA family toxin [Gammaproteobacteria bacterium]
MVSKQQTLNIWMNGLLTGRLTRHSSGGLIFSYDKEWLGTEGARPISLSMPLRHQAYSGELVYNFFDNLLPDNRGIRDRIQARFKANTSHPFDLLAAIGMDCVGAIQIVADNQSPKDVKKIDGIPLTDIQIGAILRNYRSAPLGMSQENDHDFRISLAGAQEKTALLKHNNEWYLPQGTTPTTHILKLPIGRIEHSGMDLSESCENEWLCLQLARAFDLPVCEAEISNFKGTKALVVGRFDRRPGQGWIMRLPQEDMCQALGISPNLKYENDGGPGISAIMKLLLQSHEAKVEREIFFKSQVLFWLLAAIDGHAKNYSVFIQAGGRFKLTPLYDIMSAYPLIANRQLESRKIKMAMALQGKNRHYDWHNIQSRHFLSAARSAGFSTKSAASITQEVLDTMGEAIDSVKKIIPVKFPEQIADSIFEGMTKQRDRIVQSNSKT